MEFHFFFLPLVKSLASVGEATMKSSVSQYLFHGAKRMALFLESGRALHDDRSEPVVDRLFAVWAIGDHFLTLAASVAKYSINERRLK